MTEKIIGLLAHFIIAVISATGYLGITLLMGIESACIPLPSEIIMPFSGYLVYTGRFQLLWVATAGAIGCNLGRLGNIGDKGFCHGVLLCQPHGNKAFVLARSSYTACE